MKLSPATAKLVTAINTFSRNKLTRREDLGTLIELAELHNKKKELGELSFLAKFVSNSYRIMKRIGKDGEGYEKLSREFALALEKSKTLVGALIEEAPQDTKKRFASTYLDMTQGAMQNLVSLCYDLSWYKNWNIEHPKNQG
jgi:hypothetical protein